MRQRFAICNETFGDLPWAQVCRAVAGHGYDGIEIAPFTLAPTIDQLSPSQRRDIKQAAIDNNLDIVGLHWLLAKPPGFHIHTRDEGNRQRTVDYLRQLIDFAGDVGATIMVFGSPAQRRLEEGDLAGARQRTEDSFRQVLPTLEARGVTLCMESLPPPECDFINVASEAADLVKTIGHPHFQLMLDVKSMSAEPQPIGDIIRAHCPIVRHVHANDANMRGPGFGDTDFTPVAGVLKECGFDGYVSVEVFDYKPDPDTIARESLRFLRAVWSQ